MTGVSAAVAALVTVRGAAGVCAFCARSGFVGAVKTGLSSEIAKPVKARSSVPPKKTALFVLIVLDPLLHITSRQPKFRLPHAGPRSTTNGRLQTAEPSSPTSRRNPASITQPFQPSVLSPPIIHQSTNPSIHSALPPPTPRAGFSKEPYPPFSPIPRMPPGPLPAAIVSSPVSVSESAAPLPGK